SDRRRRDPQAGHRSTDRGLSALRDSKYDNWTWRAEPRAGEAVVFDIDGVLSDAAGRQHYLERGRRDWDAFFRACGDDPVIDEVARLLELLDPTLATVLLTGRPMSVQDITVAWLTRYELRWD